MRDRLIELIEEGIDGRNNLTFATMRPLPHYLADHLLTNRVVVIQCNIGDTVYQTDGIRIYELEILDVSLIKNKPYYETESIDFDSDAIGKSIFLTREQAEAKLKEGKG